MKNLIINADDLGLSRGVTRGIIDAHLKGVVTSTSALMNSPIISESLAVVNQESPDLGVGVHLVLTWGKPLLPPGDIPTLVDGQGNFYRFHQLSSQISLFNLNEVRAEWQEQIESFIASGRQPDHLDSHHHSSYSSQGLFTVMAELAQEYNLPIRYPTKPEGNFPESDTLKQILEKYPIHSPQACITSFYGQSVSIVNLIEILSTIPEGVSEIMCHPGYADRELIESSSYTIEREMELQLLVSPEIKAAVEENGVILGRFSDL
jgi:predicted glycoside hydrolase/deacetylase ChbG (UPF0249 family)